MPRIYDRVMYSYARYWVYVECGYVDMHSEKHCGYFETAK